MEESCLCKFGVLSPTGSPALPRSTQGEEHEMQNPALSAPLGTRLPLLAPIRSWLPRKILLLPNLAPELLNMVTL